MTATANERMLVRLSVGIFSVKDAQRGWEQRSTQLSGVNSLELPRLRLHFEMGHRLSLVFQRAVVTDDRARAMVPNDGARGRG